MEREGPIVLVTADPSGPESRACLSRYFAELARLFDGGFDPGDQTYAGRGEVHCVLAMAGGTAVGCGFLQWRERDDAAEIKRMWVAPDFRGQGISRAILAHLEARAAELGFGAVRLDTNQALQGAQALYLSSGYREIPRYNDNTYAHHWYGKRLR